MRRLLLLTLLVLSQCLSWKYWKEERAMRGVIGSLESDTKKVKKAVGGKLFDYQKAIYKLKMETYLGVLGKFEEWGTDMQGRIEGDPKLSRSDKDKDLAKVSELLQDKVKVESLVKVVLAHLNQQAQIPKGQNELLNAVEGEKEGTKK